MIMTKIKYNLLHTILYILLFLTIKEILYYLLDNLFPFRIMFIQIKDAFFYQITMAIISFLFTLCFYLSTRIWKKVNNSYKLICFLVSIPTSFIVLNFHTPTHLTAIDFNFLRIYLLKYTLLTLFFFILSIISINKYITQKSVS